MKDILVSITMLAGILLTIGAGFAWRRRDAKRALLMLIAALVMFGNVAVWLMPLPAPA